MLVYRVENAKHRGMYTCYANGVEEMEFSPMRHPMPDDDSTLVRSFERVYGRGYWEMRERDCQFGFASMPMLKRWLYTDEAKEALKAEGFVIAVLEVPTDKVAVGDTQVIFDYRNAERKWTIDLVTEETKEYTL